MMSMTTSVSSAMLSPSVSSVPTNHSNSCKNQMNNTSNTCCNSDRKGGAHGSIEQDADKEHE